MKIISENTLVLVNHARHKKKTECKENVAFSNFDKSNKTRLCDVMWKALTNNNL